MGKWIAILALINIGILEAGSFLFPSNPLMWLAGTSTGYIIVRVVIMLLLLILLLTNPPRHVLLRVLAGTVATVVLVTVLAATFNGTMPILDSMTLISASIAMGIISLEINNEEDNYVDVEMLRQAKHNQRVRAH